MKKVMSLSFIILAFTFGMNVLSGCDKSENVNDENAVVKENAIDGENGDCTCLANAPASITPEEEEMLVFMREEEKLARDVYLAMYEQYQEQVFSNISNSEQRHMDRILCLLEHYGIDDPASTEVGVFTNPELQQLYNDLISQGSASLIDALTVGATIEDVDIYDIENYLNVATNDAIITIFGRLMCGSRNHIRAFSSILENNGTVYTPQFISQDAYDEILASEHERCGNGNGPGNGQGNNGNSGNCNGGGSGNNGNNGNNGNCNGGGNGNNGGNGNGGNGGNGGNCGNGGGN